MRRVVIVVLIVVIALLAYNYFQTGEVRLLPRRLSSQEEKLLQLEKALEHEKRDLKALEREANAVGGATIGEAEQKMKKIEQLEKEIAELKAEPVN